MSQKDAGAAAGNEGIIVILTNKGPATCTVDGYPGVGLLDASGTLLATNVRRGSSMLGRDRGPHAVSLDPGAAASATVGFVVGPTGCDNVTSFQVTPPDETAALKVSVTSAAYDGKYRYMCAPAVTALVAGSTGSPA